MNVRFIKQVEDQARFQPQVIRRTSFYQLCYPVVRLQTIG